MITPKIIAPDRFKLSEQDKHSSLWVRLEAQLIERLDRARRKNDDPKLTEARTAALRGEIECLKGLIALGKSPPKDGITTDTR